VLCEIVYFFFFAKTKTKDGDLTSGEKTPKWHACCQKWLKEKFCR